MIISLKFMNILHVTDNSVNEWIEPLEDFYSFKKNQVIKMI